MKSSLKQLYIISALFISPILASAQVGVNTGNLSSNAVLHIDPKANNAKTGTPTITETADDIFIDSGGNVGIGTVSPTAKLHIVTGGTATAPNPQLRINDGSQVTDRILTLNTAGNGTWQEYIPPTVFGNFPSTGVNIPSTETSRFLNTNATITLGNGTWLVNYTIILNTNTVIVSSASTNARLFISTVLADDDTLTSDRLSGNRTSDVIGGSLSASNVVFVNKSGVISGRILVKNSSLTDKTYYLLAGYIRNPASLSGVVLTNVGAQIDGNNFYAFKVSVQ